MRTRTVMMTTLIALTGALAACGDDADPSPAAAAPDDAGPAGDEPAEPDADGTPSAWYSELDGLAVPAAGTGTLLIGSETIDLTVRCDIAVGNVAFDGVPEQGDEVFKLTVSGSGQSADDRNVSVFAFRIVNPDHMRPDPYESDRVQINVSDGDENAASALEIRRAEAGGPVRDDHELPLLRIQPDGPTLTAVGETTPMAGNADPAIVGPFEFAAHCG